MTAQIITTPSGERLVVLPEDEFLALQEAAEDRADAEAVIRFLEKMAAGTEELIPAEIVDRLLGGESKVRVWRTHRGLSARDLAAASGLSAHHISEIESGKKDVSVAAMKRIAEALGVDLDDIV